MPVVSLPSGRQYDAEVGESLLAAALRAGITLEHSCRTGRCSACKARVPRGSTESLHEELGLSLAEREAGWILTCVRSATTDVALDVEDLGHFTLFPAKTWPCRIQSLVRLAPDVIQVVLRLPPTGDLRFHPGQYIDILGPDGLRRSYSIANAPAADKRIELHIRQVPGGAMSQYWFEQAKVNDLLRLNGPLGTFFLRDVADLDLVFLATGTGIAPVKAMLEGLAQRQGESLPRSISVYWGGRVQSDIYWEPPSEMDQLQFSPVLSRVGEDWAGERGHVQTAVLRRAPQWHQTRVYACGSDAMIHGARQALVQAGLSERFFHSDAFVCSAAT
jgi:CDP-4-dehydro-6-deoxyglucose reductase